MSLFGFGSSAAPAPAPSPAPETTASNGAAKKGSKFRKEPVPLIEVDEDAKFSVNPEAREIFAELEGKICVVSVAGLYRTGKSSLVNFLLETERGFKVGPTIRRCTRGIWFWGSPRRCALPSGEPCWVVVLDTEGLGGLEADAHYDTRIFSLATLLCSTLVYNSLGSIDESAISNLSFVANLSQHIRVSDHDDPTQAELDALEFHKFFPSFVWVVRDFALDLVDDYGTAITSDDYLERALRTQVGFDAATTERNRVRQMMTAFFANRHCHPLVRPLVDEEQLQQIDDVDFGSLREEFRDGVEALKTHLYEDNLKPKEVNGRALNGASFIGLVEQYISAIEGGSVPTISTAWEEVMIRECQDAMQLAEQTYEHAMAEDTNTFRVGDDLAGAEGDATRATGGSVPAEKVYRAHFAAQKKAVAVFRSRAGGEQMPKLLEELEVTLTEKLAAILKRNEATSKAQCTSAVAKLHEDIIKPKMKKGANGESTGAASSSDHPAEAAAYADMASLRYDISTLGAKYAAVASGPARDQVLAEYALGSALDSAQWLFERVDDLHERKMGDLERAASEAAQALARVEAHEKVLTDALEQQQREVIAISTAKVQVEAQVKAQELRLSSLLTELQRSNRRKEELEHDLEDAKDALEAEQTWQTQLHARLEEMETKSTHKESKLDELGSLLEQHKKEGDERAVLLEQHKEREQTLEQRVQDWEAKHAEIGLAVKAAEREREQLKVEMESLRSVGEHEAAKAVELAEKLAKVQAALDASRRDLDATRDELQRATSEAGASASELEQRLDAKEAELDAALEESARNEAARKEGAAELATKEAALDEATKQGEQTQASLDGATATHAELLRAHAALGAEHRAFQQKMNQRITYLKSQLDEHQSSSSTTSSELQRKAVREVELEKRLEVEINLRATMQSDKDAQVFDLQKKLAESTTRLRHSEARVATLKSTLDISQTELNQISAQRAVLLDEKEKMQALWEKSLTDHFNSLHETQAELADHKSSSDKRKGSTQSKMEELEAKLVEYRTIVERVQTKKEGLLRKRTRSRLVKQTWHVKCFRLVGHALLHRDTDNSGAGEKTFALDAGATVEVCADAAANGGRVIKNAFKIVNASNEEILVAAIDRSDMQDWIDALNDVLSDLAKTEKTKLDMQKRFDQEQLDD